jgi:RNA polymerase sigma factor (sigma-70 family)
LSALAPAGLAHAPQPLPADATRLLYERHSGRIFGYCLSLLGSREDAEDAVQTTFVNAQRGLDRGVVPQFELAWLFRIARNVCYNTRDSASRRGRVETARDLDALQDILATPERGAGVSIGELTRALGSIPERQRHALLLREFQGLSYEEIATELDVSVAAVETLLFRARRAVADQLEQPETKRLRGAVAAFIALFRWPFHGGVAPLKIAAIAATAATTATVAAVPLIRADARPSAPLPAQVDRQPVPSRADVTAIDTPTRARRERVAPTTSPASDPSTPAPSPVTPEASAQATTEKPPPPAPTSAKADMSNTLPAVAPPSTEPPSIEVPSVTVPPLTTPEATVTTPAVTVTVPAISLPAVSLPEVELPPLPALP